MAYENKDNLLAGMIIAGIDPETGEGQVYTMPLGGSILRQPVTIGGSGSTFIYGLVDREWRPNMTKQEAIDFVTMCVSHAMARDGSSGGVVRTVVLTAEGYERNCLMGDDLPFGP